MRSSTLTSLAFAALANAAVIKRSAGGENVLYWGANDSENNLASYCSGQGVDVVVLAFLDKYGNGVAPNGYVGSCLVDTGSDSVCTDVANDISTCQSNGVKVFISLGGGGATGTLTSQADAEGVAYTLWNSFASPSATSNSPRPFGNSFVNGWDFDIESNPNNNNVNYKYLVNKLRSYFSQDSSNTYYISGAPQCVVPDANMGDMISNSQFDYLLLQFYNTDQCAAYQVVRNNGGSFTFDDWYNEIQGSSSANAKLFIGLPASPNAADSSDFFITETELPTLINEYGSHSGYAGMMLYDGGASDSQVYDGCPYDLNVKTVMTSGNPC